jgi:hypothetical protein
MKRALVAVGVDRTATPDFRPLSAAAAGAKEFGAWAGGQAFDVTLLTDDGGPVTIAMFFDAVRKLVDAGVYSQLVVYFSGHGVLLSPDAEVWLLSGALASPNEAVNVSASIVAARTCGIPHVVFISDACRSMPANFRMGSMTPGSVFPTRQPRPPGPEVDVFYATLPGDTALELPPDEAEKRYRGLLTDCLLKALKGVPTTLIERVKDAAGTRQVVACRPLKTHLIQAVPAAAAAVSIQLVQDPDARIESALPKYLADVTAPPPAAAAPSTPVNTASSDDSNGLGLVRTWQDLIPDSALKRLRPQSEPQLLSRTWSRWASSRTYDNLEETMDIPDVGDVKDSMRKIVESASRRSFETRTGFTFNGLEIRYVRATGTPQEPDLFEENGAMHARVYAGERGENPTTKRAALIRFTNGSGLILSVLPGYIGTIVAETGRVLTVNYTPSQHTAAYEDYRDAAKDIEQCRALVATLARHGSFRFNQDTAVATARLLRRHKRLDPTLGLFASYAYAQSGHSAGALSVYRYMVRDQLPVFFDVAMLAAQVSTNEGDKQAPPFPPPSNLDFAPWLPLLTQGWLLLGPFEEATPAVLRKAKQYLVPGLWTTFAPEGLDILEIALFGGTKQ